MRDLTYATLYQRGSELDRRCEAVGAIVHEWGVFSTHTWEVESCFGCPPQLRIQLRWTKKVRWNYE